MADVIGVSQRFRDTVRQSHRVAHRAEIRRDGALIQVAGIVEGSVTLDQTAATRGQIDVDLAVDTVPTPTGPLSASAPYGNELYVWRGIQWTDGSSELVPLGVYRIDDTDADGASLRVSGQDRSARLIDARIEAAYQVSAGTQYGAAIVALLRDAWPTMPYDSTEFGGITTQAPQLAFAEGDDRWGRAQEMATSCGMDLWFDGTGTLRLTPVAGSSSPVAEIHEGATGVLVEAAARWSRAGTYNRVIATGENTAQDAPPVRGVATDDNPQSPTYYYGPFGRVPRFYSSPFLTTDAQCASAATAILNRQLGATKSVSFGSLVLPYLEPRDAVSIRRPRAGVDEVHVIDKLTIPLGVAGTMTGSTRALTI
ncbi:MAG: DUF5047 domain-containing protein [Patulibacter minatonensis]